MSLLFDSTVLIAHLRGAPEATELLVEATSTSALASVVSRAEIEGGMRSDERRDVARLFRGLELVPVSDPIARRAGVHLRRFRRSHPGVDLADYLIAATAEEMGVELATLNVKHFPMFPKLLPPWVC
ncbi:MAG TPA: type II toxin-antitoxin system VapC family toxin [Acidimicrobiales bacterium]|jgi:predicted nucleic acid-binding protein|nr:type II toxin-antitoxin system VapC family toxin [Acidimicrobiales bacterium]